MDASARLSSFEDCQWILSGGGGTIGKLWILAVLLFCVAGAKAQQNAPSNSVSPPIRVEISQPAEIHASWEKWISLAQTMAWPAVVIVGLFLFRQPLTNFLDVVGKRATEISIGGLGIKLPTMNQAVLDEEVLTFQAADAFMVVSSSAKTSLFSMFEKAGTFEFVAINLGRGDKWLSSRLFIFATMLQRMKALRCIVFLGAGADTERRFIGAATPEKVRWGLAMLQPWLELAYAQAYAGPVPVPLPVVVTNENGALDATQAEQLVKNFISNLTIAPPPPLNEFEWVTLSTNQPPEHASWLSPEYLEQGFGFALWHDTVVASETKKEARSLLGCSAPFVAKVKKNGEFLALIDRVAFLDEVVGKISDKLETRT